MARSEDVVPLLVGWLVWDWFFGDGKDGEQDGNDEESGVIGSNLERPPEGGGR
jgi:hypothetical protein